MLKFVKKWDKKCIQDDGPFVSKEFSSFYRQFVNGLKRSFPLCEVTVRKGHYDISGFLSQDGKHIYFSYAVPRGNLPIDFSQENARNGFLYRKAKDTKDYTGSLNHFCSGYDFVSSVNRLFSRI